MPNHGKGGRPKGSSNKRTAEFLEVLEKHNFCAASAMIEIFKDAKTDYVDTRAMPETSNKFLKIAGDMAKEIASYAHPKLKAIERTVDPELLERIKEFESKSTEELVDLLNTLTQSKHK